MEALLCGRVLDQIGGGGGGGGDWIRIRQLSVAQPLNFLTISRGGLIVHKQVPMLTDLVSNHAHFYHVYIVLRLRGRTPDAGSDPPSAPQCNANHLPRLRGLTLLLCSSKFVGFDPTCGVWHRFLCVCKQKTGSAPAMYGTFPWVAREIFYLSSFILPRLRGLLLERDHCVNAGQWTPPPPPPRRIWSTFQFRPRNRGTV